MRGLCVVAIACLVIIAAEGCKRTKREPVPGPQSGMLGVSAATFAIASPGRSPGNTQHDANRSADAHSGAPKILRGTAGIAWFQGSVEEAFSRDANRRVSGSTKHVVPVCRDSVPPPERIRRGSSADDHA